MKLRPLAIIFLSIGAFAAAPATQASNPALERQLAQVDAQAAKIKSLSADFLQRKFTSLLKEPLLSSGTIRAQGDVIRWDTKSPEPTVLWANASELRLYYPQQKLEEIYPLDQRLADLLTSPLPRLATIRAHFTIAPADPATTSDVLRQTGVAPPPQMLALHLTPSDASLAQHVSEVIVILDTTTGVVDAVRTTDADGDQTVIAFSNVKLDPRLSPDELDLKIPPGVSVSHPLQGIAGAPGTGSSAASP